MNEPGRPDDLSRRLDRAVAAPCREEVDDALDRVHRRARRLDPARSPWVAAAAVAAALAVVAGGIGVAALSSHPADELRAGGREGTASSTSTTSLAADEWPEGWRSATTLAPGSPASAEEIAAARVTVLDVLDLDPDGGGRNPLLLRSGNLLAVTSDTMRIFLGLRADGWPAAQEITEAVGPSVAARAVEITVGSRWYPTGAPTSGDECRAVAELATPSDAGGVPTLDARIELESHTVRSGADLSGRIIAIAPGAPVEYATGPTEIGYVVRRGTYETVGVWQGAMASIGSGVTFDAEETALDLVAGTARCHPEGSPGLAPGPYDLVWGPEPPGGATEPVVIRARTPITVTG